MSYLKSILIWLAILFLILIWLPLMALSALFEREPARYRTGRLFRKLDPAISRVNADWVIHMQYDDALNVREPYVVVAYHLSNADIPLISNLPWEMKWVAKKELFSIPVVGWMMRLARDISVDRKNSSQSITVFKTCVSMLDQKVSVMFFPEGTRSRTGKLNRFTKGAFDLAIRTKTPILPIVIDGTQNCLPKTSWVFERSDDIRLKTLEPVSVDGYGKKDADRLMNDVRQMMIRQLSEWRGVPENEVDGMASRVDGVAENRRAWHPHFDREGRPLLQRTSRTVNGPVQCEVMLWQVRTPGQRYPFIRYVGRSRLKLIWLMVAGLFNRWFLFGQFRTLFRCHHPPGRKDHQKGEHKSGHRIEKFFGSHQKVRRRIPQKGEQDDENKKSGDLM